MVRRWLRRPRLKILLISLGAIVVILLALFVVATYRHLGLPAPTGSYSVGKVYLAWHDTSRPEVMTPDAADDRELPLQIWYPAEPTDESPGAYIPTLDRIADGLKTAGEANWIETWGLKYIRPHAVVGAPASGSKTNYPVIIFSPGQSTNLEFYSSYAEELASHGYIVVGINHPFDVAAVELSDGGVAVIPPAVAPDPKLTAERVDTRKGDILYVLDHLEDLNAADGVLRGRLAASEVAAVGHSLGGVAAAQACAADQRLRSCINLDGLQLGGPFSVAPGEPIPTQPFRLITKTSTWLPRTQDLVESVPNASFTLIDGASHDDFSDGPLLVPGLNPFTRGADEINGTIRASILDFLEETLPSS